MNPLSVKNILIAPLDWGLGHATRCMPLIDLLLRYGQRVIIAGNGDSFFLLKEQYPDLTFYELPGYNITYPAGKSAAVQALLQTPKVLKTISLENKVVDDIVQKEKIDIIISDNRYGVRHEQVKSIFICHQVALQAPPAARFMNPVFLRLHMRQIRKFDALWIPDEAGAESLSGKLSHSIDFKMPHQYIGVQSRFAAFTRSASFIDDMAIDVLVVLSGPEPQRTSLEETLKAQLKNIDRKIVLVQGKTAQHTITQDGNITTISYLNTNDLFTALQKAEKIICRSGYSTVMDLAVLGKKAILIPTEGQTEQEYLAETLSSKGYASTCNATDLNIRDILELSQQTTGFPLYNTSNEALEMEIKNLIS